MQLNASPCISQACGFRFWRDICVELVATFVLISVQTILAVDWTTVSSPSPADRLGSSTSPSTDVRDRHPSNTAVGTMFQSAIGTWMIVTSLVCTFWRYGGCLMNPALTLAFVISGRITLHKGMAQIRRIDLAAMAALTQEAQLSQ